MSESKQLKKRLTLKIPGYPDRRHAQGVILKEGQISENPGRVGYSKCRYCRDGRRVDGHLEFYAPQLVRMHRSIQGLELWFCEGCPNLLIRLDRGLQT